MTHFRRCCRTAGIAFVAFFRRPDSPANQIKRLAVDARELKKNFGKEDDGTARSEREREKERGEGKATARGGAWRARVGMKTNFRCVRRGAPAQFMRE